MNIFFKNHHWRKYHNWNYKDTQQKTGVGNFSRFSCILIMSHTPYVAACGGWGMPPSTVPTTLWEQKPKELMGQWKLQPCREQELIFLNFIVLRLICCSQTLWKKMLNVSTHFEKTPFLSPDIFALFSGKKTHNCQYNHLIY